MKTTIYSRDPEPSLARGETHSAADNSTEIHARLTALSLKALLLAGALLAGSNASAEIQVSAFESAKGYRSIINNNLERAEKSFPASATRRLDYADINNLCVLRILQRNHAEAQKTCKKAISKVGVASMKPPARRNAKAGIYANLAAAQILDGQYADARFSLDKALLLSKAGDLAESNAMQNERVLQSRLLAAN